MTKRKPPEKGTYLYAYITAEKRRELGELAKKLPLKRATLSGTIRYLIDWAIANWGGDDEEKRAG